MYGWCQQSKVSKVKFGTLKEMSTYSLSGGSRRSSSTLVSSLTLEQITINFCSRESEPRLSRKDLSDTQRTTKV